MTGNRGTIGSLLAAHLDNHHIRGLDRPDADVSDDEALQSACHGADAVIHLAGVFDVEHFRSDAVDPRNVLMDVAVVRAVARTAVPRLVLASSVHTDAYLTHRGPELLRGDRVGVPTSPYGARKQMLEALGRYLAASWPVEVVAIRFGGVGRTDRPAPGREGAVFLSRRDCVSCIAAVLAAPVVPGRFTCFYAVSDNPGRVHDLTNPYGWQPAPR